MKKILLLAGVAASGAQIAPAAEGQFPVLKTEKSCQLVVPEGQSESQVYFSKDCSTAYVLPPTKMKMKVSKPALLAGSEDNLCVIFGQKLQASTGIVKRQEKLKDALDQIMLSNDGDYSAKENRVRDIKRQIQLYDREVKNLMKPFDSMAAMRARVSLTNDVMESIRAFQDANKSAKSEGDKVYPVRFMPAHLTESIAVISDADEFNDNARSVVKVNFPAEPAVPVAGVTRDPNAKYLIMNGGLSGIVDISTSAYCRNKDNIASLDELFTSAVAVNLSFKTRVQVGVKVEAIAKIQTTNFLRNIESSIRKGKYMRDEFIRDVIVGGLENSLQVMIDDKGAEYKIADLLKTDADDKGKSPLGPLLGRFMTNYVERAEDKLEQLGIFTKEEPVRAPEVQNGTESVQTGTVRKCSSSSSWGGLWKSSSCSNVPVYVQVDHDGLSAIIKDQKDESYIQESIHYETNETTTIQHTSQFVTE